MKFFYTASAVQQASGMSMPKTAGMLRRPRAKTTKTLLLGVKLAILLLLTTCLGVSAKKTAAQKLSISLKNSSIEKLFAEIEKKTSYVFFYDATILKGTKPVTVEMKDASVEDVLKVSLKGQSLVFAINEQTIFVKKGSEKAVALAPAAVGREKGGPPALSMLVRSETGAPLAGASVFIKKLKKSGLTDENGEFLIRDVPDGEYEVEISFIGYESKMTKVIVENHEAKGVTDLKIMLGSLDQMMVKGYYTTTNRLNTGNVTKVKGEDLEKQPVSDPVIALEGRVPGLYIQQSSGIAGSNPIIRLRGQNSISNGNSPLFIVDGVPFTSTTLTSSYVGRSVLGLNSPGQGSSPFNSLNPSDIESIEVLKDADATAIYGSRGANGVILITTKKGRKDQTKFTVNMQQGIEQVSNKLKLLNTQQYLQLRHEAFNNDGKTPAASDYDINGTWDTTRYTDWQKVLIGGTAQFTNAQASLSGGTANTQFLIGGGYNRRTTVYPGNYSDRKAGAHVNINHASSDQKFHALFSAQYGNDNNTLPNSEFTSSIVLAPDAPALYDANGSINWQNGTWTNPMAFSLAKSISTTDNLIGNLRLDYDVFKGLQLKASLGYTHMQMNQSYQLPATTAFGPPQPSRRTNSFGTTNLTTWIIEPQINYTRKIAAGKLEALVGSTFQKNIQNTIGQSATGFTNDYQIPNIAAASSITLTGSDYNEYRYNGLFGRVGYNWMDKYVVNATARRDGSSRFGPGKQFGNFGAIGAAWIFSKENFVQDRLSFLSFGKLRASYGTSGNEPSKDYQYLSSYLSYANPYLTINGLMPARIANPYFAWEQVTKLEAGLELGFIKDRFLLNLSFYRNRTGNQLVDQALPSIDGFTKILANLPAVVQNTGIELELNTINIRGKDFSWNTSFNISIPRNKLISFPNLAISTFKNTYAIGRSLFVQKQYHFTGVDPQTGLNTFEDVNKDGSISSTQDYQFLKEITQKAFGGLGNAFAYKNWHLDVFLQFVKQTGYDYSNYFSTPGFYNKNQLTLIMNRWTKPGENTDIQKLTQGGSSTTVTGLSNALSSDRIVGDNSFIRVKNVSLSYLMQPGGKVFKSLRIYMQAQNLFTITKYKGLDPESPGLVLPPLRVITAGLELIL